MGWAIVAINYYSDHLTGLPVWRPWAAFSSNEEASSYRDEIDARQGLAVWWIDDETPEWVSNEAPER